MSSLLVALKGALAIRRIAWKLLPVVGLGVFATVVPPGLAQAASADVLILEMSVTGGINNLQAQQATILGLRVDVVRAETWGSLTRGDFEAYKAIILGDPSCVFNSEDAVGMTESTVAIWGPAVTGTVIVSGTDAALHDIPRGSRPHPR